MTTARATVSSPDELLILVDEQDREIGNLSKQACHEGAGLLHRAFSIFLFNPAGELLLQQRSEQKPLWPLYWSNSCCSHPRQGERIEAAVRRRVREELALDCAPQFLYKFQYHAAFGDRGSERELCWVYAARCDGEPSAHPEEIAAWRWISPEALTEEIAREPERFTPWLKLEWEVIRREHLQRILQPSG
ncbi:MAG: isopentenyl-diphosphate Delta-isomerase [Gammaproteobacteria bacterium]|nr:MAG: isopentenyl-diphosphate Delta-isomerase [Gammaproteobacteria bacterium]